MGVPIKARVQFTPRGDIGRFIAVTVTDAVRAGVEAAGEVLAAEARRLCPVDTGKLRDSISMEVVETSKTILAHVSASAPYAGYVEYGTGIAGSQSPGRGPYPYNPRWPGMAAQPFLRPALDSGRELAKKAFMGDISIGMEKP